ncbi:hypothetical protein SpCBS45565_g07093 [Spizellomyces sp. 'palustris']|nr:hypothetical protein SpCBS45565_g07093 [Spizellomyces sp. 'palustris']
MASPSDSRRDAFRFKTIHIAIFTAATVLPGSLLVSAYVMFKGGKCCSQVCPEKEHLNMEMRNSLVTFYGWLAVVAVVFALAQRTSWGHGHSWKHRYISLSRTTKWSYAEIVVWLLVLGHQLYQFTYWYTQYHSRFSTSSSIQRMWRATYKAIAYNAGIQLSLTLLPTSRNGLLSTLFGIGYDHSLSFHRWSGALTVLLAGAHVCAFAAYCLVRSGWAQFWRIALLIGASHERIASYRGWLGPVGLVSLLLFLWVSLNSFQSIRRTRFNWFWFNHFAVLGAILLSFVHASPMLYYALPTLTLYIIDSCVRVFNRRRAYNVTSLTMEDCGYVRLDIADCHIPAAPGQWVSICVPAVSNVEWHPFTVANSSPPRRRGGPPEMEYLLARSTPVAPGLSLIIKPQAHDASWTQSLVRTWQETTDPESGTPIIQVHIDGPYGSLPPRFLRSDHVLIVVGGSGIPGGLAIARSILENPPPRIQKIHFWWTCRAPNASQLSLYQDLLAHPRATSLLVPRLIITSPKTGTHRLSVASICSQLETRPGDVVSVYGCGPVGLMDDVRNEVGRLGRVVGDGFETSSDGGSDVDGNVEMDPERGRAGRTRRGVRVLLHIEGYGR